MDADEVLTSGAATRPVTTAMLCVDALAATGARRRRPHVGSARYVLDGLDDYMDGTPRQETTPALRLLLPGRFPHLAKVTVRRRGAGNHFGNQRPTMGRKGPIYPKGEAEVSSLNGLEATDDEYRYVEGQVRAVGGDSSPDTKTAGPAQSGRARFAASPVAAALEFWVQEPGGRSRSRRLTEDP
jgi:hypothetical protein